MYGELQSFKGVMARWASGITIVTSCQGGTPIGMTANSFTSVSLQPPQILICVGYQALTHAAIAASGYFAVNILAVEQIELGARFAGLTPEIEDRFAGMSCSTARTGAPILPGVLAWLDCQVRHAIDSGDHTIYVADVIDCAVCSDAPPLLYYRRSWRQLHADALNDATE